MKNIEVDYGPLTALIGCWKSDQGIDLAPEPNATETNAYSETLTFTAIGSVTNAEDQVLAGVHYLQQIARTKSGKPLHHQTGYWLWDAKHQQVIQTLTIPRGVALVAKGDFTDEQDQITLTVNTKEEISQTDFMKQNANTTAYTHTVIIKNNTLHYQQTTTLDIYQGEFKHTDKCLLKKA